MTVPSSLNTTVSLAAASNAPKQCSYFQLFTNKQKFSKMKRQVFVDFQVFIIWKLLVIKNIWNAKT